MDANTDRAGTVGSITSRELTDNVTESCEFWMHNAGPLMTTTNAEQFMTNVIHHRCNVTLCKMRICTKTLYNRELTCKTEILHKVKIELL